MKRKMQRFVEEYIVDLNGRQAAIRAAYSPKTAEVQASRLLRNAKVQQALKTAMRAQSRRTEITADSVVAEYAKVAFANVRDFLPKEGETIDLSGAASPDPPQAARQAGGADQFGAASRDVYRSRLLEATKPQAKPGRPRPPS